MADTNSAAGLLAGYGLELARVRDDILIAGSPERCVARTVVEDARERLFVLERLFAGQQDGRIAVSAVLEMLSASGLCAPAYLRTSAGGFLLTDGVHDYQLAPYVPGDDLPRPAYIEDAERGRALARWLTTLREAGPRAVAGAARAGTPADTTFSLPEYAADLMESIRRTAPQIVPGLAPAREALGALAEAWTDLPSALCHGDFHPLNVIWRGSGVVAVIDWEFTGVKPDLYDAANLIGCVGIEDPAWLVRGLVPAFVNGLREGGVLREDNARWLFPLVLAVRMAWMSEWLRKKDGEMQEMEQAYLRVLADNRDALERAWKI